MHRVGRSRSAACTRRRAGSAAPAGPRRSGSGQPSKRGGRGARRGRSRRSRRARRTCRGWCGRTLTSPPPVSVVDRLGARHPRAGEPDDLVALGIGQQAAEHDDARVLHGRAGPCTSRSRTRSRAGRIGHRGRRARAPAGVSVVGRGGGLARLRRLWLAEVGLQRLLERLDRHVLVPAAGLHRLEHLLRRDAGLRLRDDPLAKFVGDVLAPLLGRRSVWVVDCESHGVGSGRADRSKTVCASADGRLRSRDPRQGAIPAAASPGRVRAGIPRDTPGFVQHLSESGGGCRRGRPGRRRRPGLPPPEGQAVGLGGARRECG